MAVDPLMLIDPLQQSGASADVRPDSKPEESFDSILEKRLNTEKEKSERPKPVSREDKTVRANAREKTENTEKESEVVEKRDETFGDIRTDATDEATDTETVQNQTTPDSQSQTELQLTDEQLKRLVAVLGISMEELKNMQLLLENESGRLIAKMADGTKKDLSTLLGVKDNGKPAESSGKDLSTLLGVKDNGKPAESSGKDLSTLSGVKDNGKSAESSEAVAKLANLLDMDEGEAEKFLKQLKVSSIEIKAEGKPTEKAQSSGNQLGKIVSSMANKHGMETSSQNREKETPMDGKPLMGELDKKITGLKENAEGRDAGFRIAMDGPAKASQPGNSTQAGAPQGTVEVSTTKTAATKQTLPTEATDSLFKAREARVMNQIVERARILTLPNQTHARIALKPPSLGSVDIKIVMHDNHATAAIVVESAAVKQTVEQNIDQLRAALGQHGISIEEMNVSVEQQDARSRGDGEPEGEDQHSGLNEDGSDSAEQWATGAVLEEEIMKAAYNSVLNITV